MARSKNKVEQSPADDLPANVVSIAQKLGIDLAELRGWALRPDGSVVLVSGNGMKFVITPD